ncbi:hypothetical protein Metfor_0152 [Methanoregula formicica SMSP]|uniref:Uncharacterized protein n=1 Tax=Methanoregula formicica (strain DSM 22288 / NBRC 105244 / SMSP) TaxID=593750 RepID=L0HB60_METFS|nr:hypothetical protein Metfor_0152 [Methanoregula formicica SMSP]
MNLSEVEAIILSHFWDPSMLTDTTDNPTWTIQYHNGDFLGFTRHRIRKMNQSEPLCLPL